MELILGDCLEKLKELEDNSVDAIVTDPPYGLSFMGKKWDYDVPQVEVWKECLRVLKPGGYLLSFAGTRTQHRMAVNIEDVGFEIRDMIAWVYGSGFPKSLNIGKAVDKLQGNEREVVDKKPVGYAGLKRNANLTDDNWKGITEDDTGLEVTKGNSEWEGWGTALKPALEPITVARKPIEGTVAQNCLKWGVGGINIDGCRVGTEQVEAHHAPKGTFAGGEQDRGSDKNYYNNIGRFPANLIHDGSDEVVELFPQTKSGAMNSIAKGSQYNTYGKMYERRVINQASEGSAARFFYCAKASKRERNIGCEGLEEKEWAFNTMGTQTPEAIRKRGRNPENQNKPMRNHHPTVKPLSLMEYLVKLVSRQGQVVLDPFMGSGTTGMACKKLNREFIGIEMMPEYMEIAKCRIEAWEVDEQLELSKLTTK